MKNLGKVIIVFILLLIIGGFSLVWQFLEITGTMAYYFIFAMLKLMLHLPTSIFDVIENIVSNNWTLTNVLWIDSLLIHLASLTPSVILFLLGTSGLKFDPRISGTISLIAFLLVLQLFSSVIFWIIISVITLVVVILTVHLLIQHKSNQ